MCGKFTAQASWREVVSFSQPLTQSAGGEAGEGDGFEVDGDDDPLVTYRVGAAVPVIVWDAEAGRRRVVPMRWGFPDPTDWRRPRPIHARSETIDGKEPFRTPFQAGQRGIVVFRTFNEGEAVVKPSGRTETRQWTIDPRDGRPRGFAFVWRRYQIEGQPAPLLFCVMATVPANDLIRRTIKSGEDDPRMPAILEDGVWATWLGEDGAPPASAKALLRTMQGVNWTSAPEPKAPRKPAPPR
ncbi:SOS response-associated peptidase family protein [Reyranella sp.]|uniref:SOS response-associated peptidase family protein n=1 Tax=Reyranella sp. TaxID=1929291 RepID=UPI003C7AC2F4